MISTLAYALLAAALVLAVWNGIQAARQRPTNDPIMIGAIVVEVALLVETVIALLKLSDAHLAEPATFIAYSIGVLIPIPLGFQLARIERTKWGSLTLCFMAVVAGVMTLRLLQLWNYR